MDKRQKQAKARKAAQKRRANVSNVFQTMAERLTDKLKELAAGTTYPEKLKAHADFYDTCNPAEKMWLRLKFWEYEEQDLNDGAIA